MKKILVIEDNREVRENTVEILQLSNYLVLTAEDGKMGVELALREKPDLVVCDIMMPVLDGYGVYHLLSKHPETATIPFIYLTAKSEKGDFRKGMEMGADDYITKPFDGIELLNAIEIRLKKSALVRQQYEGANALNNFWGDVEKSGKVNLTNSERDVYNFGKKQTVYKEGQRPRVIYYVLEGKVKICKTNNDGKELITAIHGPDEFFGYLPVLEEAVYTDEAIVLEDTGLMLIPREDFLQLILNDIGIARTFIKILTKNMIELEDTLLNLAYNTLRRKVAFGLTQLLDKYRCEGIDHTVINLSRENMARTIGIATESLIRTLGDFKDEKLVDIKSGKVIVLDEKKLRNLPY